MPKHILKTSRLFLREFNHSDAGFIVDLLNSPGWLEFIGDRNVRNEEQALSYLENGPLKSYRENGFGLYLVETKNSGIRIGMCGLLKREILENPDIGFAFLPEFTGNGYALEIVKATLSYASDQLKLLKISAITKPGNEKSIRLLGAAGFVFEGQISWSGEDLFLYSLSAKP